ncbi:MAG: glycosyltransferase family 4 protein [Woeseiaceae bacterium]
MRIVYLHQYFVTPEMVGGSRSYEMARRLVAAGHDVHMVTSDQAAKSGDPAWRESVESGIQVHWASVPYNNEMSFRQRMQAFIRFAWRAAQKARELHGDLIFATSTPLTIALPAVYASRRSKVPMVFEVRDLWPAVPIAIGAIRNPVAKLMARWLERFAYRNAVRVVALAPGMREEIIATGYPPDNVSVIPNGCDLDVFEDTGSGAEIRNRYDWLQDRPLLVFTGTFGLVNGMDYLVHLAAALKKTDPDIRIVAVGGGREFSRTESLAAEAGVLNDNLYLLGMLPKNEAAAWTVAADMTIALFTGPSIVWRDAVQNKFFDSLAAGKPVANNFPGWQSKLAADAGAGLILSATDLDEAARDVVSALRDSSWMAKAGATARSLAEGRFNRDLLAAELAGVLEAALVQAR